MRKHFSYFLQFSNTHEDASPYTLSKVRNACFVADMIGETLQKVWLRRDGDNYSFSSARVVYSLLPREGWVEGRMIHDSRRIKMIISDGNHIYSYPMRSISNVRDYNGVDNTGVLQATGTKLPSRSAGNYDNNGELMHRDSRDGFHVYPEEMTQYNCGSNTADGSITPYTYQFQLLMWDEEAFRQWSDMCKDFTIVEAVVNHMNNDKRDNTVENLELTTNAKNLLHGAIVHEIARIYPEVTYTYTSICGKKYKQNVGLNFRLSIENAASVNSSIESAITRLLVNLGVLHTEAQAESDANLQLLTEACDA